MLHPEDGCHIPSGTASKLVIQGPFGRQFSPLGGQLLLHGRACHTTQRSHVLSLCPRPVLATKQVPLLSVGGGHQEDASPRDDQIFSPIVL